jgi:hypothetical protein
MKHIANPPQGRWSTYSVTEAGLWVPRHLNRPNQIQYDWAKLALQCMGRGKPNYKINAIYVEFQNVPSPGDPGDVPAYTRDEGVGYYTSLTDDRDYLRLPLLSEPRLSVADGYEEFFTGQDDSFNEMTFFAQTSGALGVNGLSFSDSSNSVAIGIALVATPVWADRTRDVIFGRAYFAVEEQVTKEPSHQIGVSWSQVFG